MLPFALVCERQGELLVKSEIWRVVDRRFNKRSHEPDYLSLSGSPKGAQIAWKLLVLETFASLSTRRNATVLCVGTDWLRTSPPHQRISATNLKLQHLDEQLASSLHG